MAPQPTSIRETDPPVPPPNPQRRDHLADAAVRVLAEQGSHGLTHRAVDTAADVPPGTTSRYFRTRDALLGGVIDRFSQRLDERVAAHAVPPADVAAALTTVLTMMATDLPHEPLALFELHLESTRNPHLRSVLTTALHARRDLIVRHCRAAGIDITESDAMNLEMAVLGILFTTLTTGSPDTLGASIRGAVHTALHPYTRAGD
ncbi:TetR/AcrR family transcriptional regulator [Actinophytocola sediminis]